MNEWIRKSIEIANSTDYLDKLHEVYPVSHEVQRDLPEENEKKLRQLCEAGDDLELLRELLKLPKFPINDPYVAFLRRDERALEKNPQTVSRIARRIREMGADNMIKAIIQPKEFNRQMGTLFRRWISTLGYPLSMVEELGVYEIAFLKGGDETLLRFANEKLKCNLDKAPDFIAKVKQKYIIGEAKFLTDYGGHQYAQLQDALRLLNQHEGEALRVAILDGVVWIKNSAKMHRTVSVLNKPAFTALLFKEFLLSLS